VPDSANVGHSPTLRTSAAPDSANVGHSPTYQIVPYFWGLY
jgi:hypothetical protein